MNSTSDVLDEALDYLIELARIEAEPDVARARLAGLRERWHDATFRLLWQREQYDDSLQYDLLISLPENDTVSLSYACSHSLPWPLRGGQRTGDRVLLRVDGIEIEIGEAIATTDFIWDEGRLADRLVDACLIRRELEAAPMIPHNDDELQSGMDAFRRARGLLTADATREWLSKYCFSLRDFENLVKREMDVARLRKSVVGDNVLEYFEENRADLESATIARLEFSDESKARRAAEEIDTRNDFYGVAEACMARGDLASETALFEVVLRNELPQRVAEAMFQAAPGTSLGPFAVGGGHELVRCVARAPAVLDDDTVRAIERRLFADWLEERRRLAGIEWFWGRAVNPSKSADRPE